MDDIEYDPTTGTYHARHEWGRELSLAYTIVETVRAAAGRDDAPAVPLYEVIDPDALERLFEPLHKTGESRSEGHVSFSIGDYRITVESDGRIELRPRESVAGNGNGRDGPGRRGTGES